jgi:2-desacetyl-2-hydroxyethyl bacteriochlorophyllide A dehydrogenase
MWTSTLELTPRRVFATKLLGRFWRGAYFSSFAPFQVQNLPRQPLPDPHWVRVRNTLAGVCGSDLRQIFVDRDAHIALVALPNRHHCYLGHEVVGEVIEVGDEIQRLRVGERVVLQHGPNCVTAAAHPLCRSCAAGNYSLCEYGAFHGMQPIGGGWSEEMLLHEQQLFRVPDELTDAQAVLLEPSAVATHAVLRHLPQTGDKVLIIGAGTIGLLTLQVIRALAPEAEIHVLARHTFQVERATRLGAAQIIYPHDSYEEIQLATGAQLYQGEWGNKMLLGGYDVIYDTAGSTQTIYNALRWARAGATLVMIGLSLHRMLLDLTPLWYQEINLIGSIDHGMENWPLGTNERKSTFEIATDMIRRGQLSPEKLITHSYPLNDYRNAVLTATDKARNHAIKVIFDYSKQPPSVVPNVRASARSRSRALTTDVEPRLSQPLNPRNVEEYQGSASLRRALPAAPVPDTDDTENEDDMKTIVVSPSKRRRFGSSSPATAMPPVADTDPHNEADDDATQVVTSSKRTRFGVASYYGSLPGFHQGLDKLGIPEEANAGEEVETTTIEAPVETPVQEPSAAIEYFEEGVDDSDIPFTYFEDVEVVDRNNFHEQEASQQHHPPEETAPQTGETANEYPWTQFITPADDLNMPEAQQDVQDAQNIVEAHTDMPKAETAVAETYPGMPEAETTNADLHVESIAEETAEAPLRSAEEPQNTLASTTDDNPNTVTITPNKRGRSKRKTATMRNSNN